MVDQVWTIVAAFLGSCLSLAYYRVITPFDAVTAITSGILFTVYGLEPFIQYYELHNGAIDRLIAFCFGLTAMHILGGVFVWLEQWRINPSSILRRFVMWRNGRNDK